MRKISPPPGFDPRTVQSVASRDKALIFNTSYNLDRLPVFIFGAGNELDALSLLEVSFYPAARCLQQAMRISAQT